MRLSEIYTSVQGEGPGIGHLTQFVRFAGCNLRCPGWPCDTQHAIDPERYRHEWKNVSVADLITAVEQNRGVGRVTLTGGEPFLQKADELSDFAESLVKIGYHIEVFTNGTLSWQDWVGRTSVTVIMDWKLPGSGEGDIGLDTRLYNMGILGNQDAVKFVVANKDDFHYAVDLATEKYPELFQFPQLYVGAAWGKVKEAEVVEWMKLYTNPFKLNVQVHNFIFDRDDREI